MRSNSGGKSAVAITSKHVTQRIISKLCEDVIKIHDKRIMVFAYAGETFLVAKRKMYYRNLFQKCLDV